MQEFSSRGAGCGWGVLGIRLSVKKSQHMGICLNNWMLQQNLRCLYWKFLKKIYFGGPFCVSLKQNEPPHDKTNKMIVHPMKIQISLGIRPVWSESLLCTQWVAKDPNLLHADIEDSDKTRRMPKLIWVFAGCTCHFVGFVMRWLKCCNWPLLLGNPAVSPR